MTDIIITPLPTLSKCSTKILHRLADGWYDHVMVTPHLQHLVELGAVTTAHHYTSTGWRAGEYAITTLTDEGRALELALTKSEINNQKDRDVYYWRERGIRNTISKELVSHNIKSEDDLLEYGYDSMMRLHINLSDKSKIAAVVGWGMLSGEAIIQAWLREGFTRRVANILSYYGIIDEEGLRDYSESELLRMPNFGKTSLAEVKRWLEKVGIVSEHTITRQEHHPTLEDYTDNQLLAEIKRRMSK